MLLQHITLQIYYFPYFFASYFCNFSHMVGLWQHLIKLLFRQ